MTHNEALENHNITHDVAVYEVTVKHGYKLDDFYAEFGDDSKGKGYNSAKIMQWMGY